MYVLIIVGAVLAYMLIAAFATKKAVALASTTRWKWLAGASSLVIFALIPTVDYVIGRIYLHLLCEREAGIEVHKVVVLDAKYFDKNGEPTFSWDGKYPVVRRLASRYEMISSGDEAESSSLNIRKTLITVKDARSGEVLGTLTSFSYFGGWFENLVSPHVSGRRCPSMLPGRHQPFLQSIFKKSD